VRIGSADVAAGDGCESDVMSDRRPFGSALGMRTKHGRPRHARTRKTTARADARTCE